MLQRNRVHILANNGDRFEGFLHVEIKSQLWIDTKKNSIVKTVKHKITKFMPFSD